MTIGAAQEQQLTFDRTLMFLVAKKVNVNDLLSVVSEVSTDAETNKRSSCWKNVVRTRNGGEFRWRHLTTLEGRDTN